MDESFYVRHEGLDGPLATRTVLDCQLKFYRQRRSGDVWVITSGPLGTIGHVLLEARIFDEVRRWMAAPQHPRARLGAEWAAVRIDDLLVGIRRRGAGVEYAFALPDGQRFGGGGGGLPTNYRPRIIERLRAVLRGERWGTVVTFARHEEASPDRR